MFKKGSSASNQSIETTQIDSLIGNNLKITGDLAFASGLRIDGSVEGNIIGTCNEKSLLVLSKESHVQGDVQAYDAVINGTIVGDVTVSHFLELQANAVIKGNINYQQLQMECGVIVDGNLKKIADEEIKALPNPINNKDLKQDKEQPTSKEKKSVEVKKVA